VNSDISIPKLEERRRYLKEELGITGLTTK